MSIVVATATAAAAAAAAAWRTGVWRTVLLRPALCSPDLVCVDFASIIAGLDDRLPETHDRWVAAAAPGLNTNHAAEQARPRYNPGTRW